MSNSSGKGIDVSLAEVACRHLGLKEHVELGVSATLGLRKTEEGPDGAESAGTSPEEGSLRTPVPSSRVKHEGSKDVGTDTGDVVDVTSKNDSLLTEASGGQLSDERIADWSDGGIVGESVNKKHRSDGPLCAGIFARDKTQETSNEEKNYHSELTVKVQSATTEFGHEEPRRDCAYSTESVLAERQRERVGDGKASLLVEVGRVAHEG